MYVSTYIAMFQDSFMYVYVHLLKQLQSVWLANYKKRKLISYLFHKTKFYMAVYNVTHTYDT